MNRKFHPSSSMPQLRPAIFQQAPRAVRSRPLARLNSRGPTTQPGYLLGYCGRQRRCVKGGAGIPRPPEKRHSSKAGSRRVYGQVCVVLLELESMAGGSRVVPASARYTPRWPQKAASGQLQNKLEASFRSCETLY
jgi:hypothetical protein